MDLKQYVYNELDKMNIDYSVIKHKAIFSEKDTNFDDFENNITIGKNLFLRNDKKKKYYLVIMPLTKKVNLQCLADKLNEKRFSFANENELDEYLKISPGSVSYLNVITAKELNGGFKEVIYIVDKELMSATKIGFHPSDNTATVVTLPDNIINVLERYDLEYHIIDL